VTARPLHPVDVLLLLVRGDQVLLALRRGTGYADGLWNLPSGKLEAGEDAVSGVLRETREEIGLRLDPADVRLAVTVHHRSRDLSARIGLVFAATHEPGRHGEPVNAEPGKCAGIRWFPADRLPPETYPYSAAGVKAFRDGEPFVLSGWTASAGDQPADVLRREELGR
jgi:8-oxo-dGTP diphosphatase